METENKSLSIEQTNEKNSEQLIKYFEQKGTPFVIARRKEEDDTDKYYILCHGRVMTYPVNTYKEAKEMIKYHSWDLLTAFVFLVSEIQQSAKKEDKQ